VLSSVGGSLADQGLGGEMDDGRRRLAPALVGRCGAHRWRPSNRDEDCERKRTADSTSSGKDLFLVRTEVPELMTRWSRDPARVGDPPEAVGLDLGQRKSQGMK